MPVPMSSIGGAARRVTNQRFLEQREAPLRAAVVPGAEGPAGLDDHAAAAARALRLRLPRGHDQQSRADLERRKRLLPGVRPIVVDQRRDRGLGKIDPEPE